MIWEKTAIAGLQVVLVTAAASGCTGSQRESVQDSQHLAQATLALDRADAPTAWEREYEADADSAVSDEEPRTIDLRAPEGDDPDGKRRPAKDDVLDVSMPTADAALAALRNSLFKVLRLKDGNAWARVEIESALEMVDGAYRGDTALVESALCVAGDGLPRALGDLEAGSEVGAARDALGVVCAMDVEFGKGNEQPRPWRGSGIRIDFLDEADCADIDIRVPNMAPQPTEYRMAGYMLSIVSNVATLEMGQTFVSRARCAPHKFSSGDSSTEYGVSLTIKYIDQDSKEQDGEGGGCRCIG